MPSDHMPASAKMRMGIRLLLDCHPLLGGLLSMWNIQEGPIQTMGVSWDGSRITLMYDPAFVGPLTTNQLQAVLMHETRHVIYGHCLMDSADWPDQAALVIAQEVTVNEGLRYLPGNPFLLKAFPQLKRDTDTHERYAVLAATPDDERVGWPDDDYGSSPGGAGDPNLVTGPHADAHVGGVDGHHGWDVMRANSAQIAAELRVAIAGICDACQDFMDDADDITRAQQSINEQFGCGNQPGAFESAIGPRTREINTQKLYQILAHMSGSGRSRGARFDRPSRRMPALLGIVPAQSLIRQRVCAVAAIDTSGSMDDATVASIAAILRRIGECTDITVVECDADIPHRAHAEFIAGLMPTHLVDEVARQTLGGLRSIQPDHRTLRHFHQPSSVGAARQP